MKRIVTIVLALNLSVLAQPGMGAPLGNPKPAGTPKAAGNPKKVETKVAKIPKIPTIAPGATANSDGNEVTSYRMKVVTQWGTEFTGVVRRTKEFDDAFANSAQQLGSKFDAQKFIELRWFNGLNGAVSFRFRDLRTLEKLDSLTSDHVAQIETKQAGDRTKRLEKEQLRLTIVQEQRAAKKLAEAEVAAKVAGAKAQTDAANLESPPQYKVWLERYPPEKGWIPAKKAQLYYNQVVLGTGALNPDEKDWIDHYEEWKLAYDWWTAEQKALTGETPPAGTQNPGHAAGAIDADNALKLRDLPPAIEHDGKEPPIPTDAKDKPAPMEPTVPPPIKTDGV